MPTSTQALTVSCPCCGQEVIWSAENRHRPFCSSRCKLIDLGAWAAEDYAVAAQEDDPLSSDLDQAH